MLVLEAYGEWGHWAEVGLKPWVPTFTLIALYLTVILTFSSGVLYLWRNSRVYLDEV